MSIDKSTCTFSPEQDHTADNMSTQSEHVSTAHDNNGVCTSVEKQLQLYVKTACHSKGLGL